MNNNIRAVLTSLKAQKKQIEAGIAALEVLNCKPETKPERVHPINPDRYKKRKRHKKVCLHCKTTYMATYSDQKFHSVVCGNAYRNGAKSLKTSIQKSSPYTSGKGEVIIRGS